VQPVRVADRAAADILGGHGDGVAGVLEHGQVDDLGQPLGQQLSKVGVLAVEDVLVEVRQVLGPLDVGPIEDLRSRHRRCGIGRRFGGTGGTPCRLILESPRASR